MKAEYNHWYKCQKGQMPEDFENITKSAYNGEEFSKTKEVAVWIKGSKYSEAHISSDYRTSDVNNDWRWHFTVSKVLAWMLVEPYKK